MSRVNRGAHAVIERWRAEAVILRVRGAEHQADVLEQCATEMSTALADQADQPAPPPTEEQLLTAKEVAERLGMKKRWVYRNADRFPFTRHLGRSVRFSEAGLSQWLPKQK
jgi:excisionase family DNA binding protein